jgi:hypothetical protein
MALDWPANDFGLNTESRISLSFSSTAGAATPHRWKTCS